MSFHTFIIKMESKHTAARKNRMDWHRVLRCCQDTVAEQKSTPSKTLQKKLENALNKFEAAEATENRFQEYLEIPDKMVEAYLDTLPNTRKTIDLTPINSLTKNSITEIPDLSRFKQLEILTLSGNEFLTEKGADKIPVSVKALYCWHTNFENAEFLGRLVNLEILMLTKNYNLRDLPDLSSHTKLRKVSIRNINAFRTRLPNLPLTLNYLECNFIRRYFVNSDLVVMFKRAIRQKMESCVFCCESWSVKPRLFLENVHRINRIQPVLAEIPEGSAKIRMHPNRIARLIEQGVLSLDDDVWGDI